MQAVSQRAGALVMAAGLLITGNVAHAAETPQVRQLNAIADTADAVQPGPGELRAITRDGPSLKATTAQGRQVSLDTSAAQLNISLGTGTSASDGLAALLPPEVDYHTADVVGSDQAVFAGEDASVTVQVLEEGVRMTTVSPSAAAPHQFTYRFPGATPTLQADGSVSLDYEVLDGITFSGGVLEEPWAYDADGRPVDTRYTVDGDSVIQIIQPHAHVQYPIVADPTWSIGLGIYAHFNRSETSLVPQWSTATISAACAAGGAATGAAGAAALGAACGLVVENIKHHARAANSSSPKRCLYIRFIPAGLLTSAYPGTYRDHRCV